MAYQSICDKYGGHVGIGALAFNAVHCFGGIALSFLNLNIGSVLLSGLAGGIACCNMYLLVLAEKAARAEALRRRMSFEEGGRFIRRRQVACFLSLALVSAGLNVATLTWDDAKPPCAGSCPRLSPKG